MSMMTLAEGTRPSLRPALLPTHAATLLVAASVLISGLLIAALTVSYLFGGIVTAAILYVYLFETLWSAPVLFAFAMIGAAGLVVRQVHFLRFA